MKKNINCHCGCIFSINYKEEIDLDKEPEILEDILNGTFMSYNCSACYKKHKPEFKIIILWKSKNLKMQVFPELERGDFYRNKNDVSVYETVIGFPEMADRLSVIKDDLEPAVIESIKSHILFKAAENYPNKDANAWYHCKGPEGIEFHIDGIRQDEVAVMRIPSDIYNKTLDDYKKRPKSSSFSSLRVRSYLSVHNTLRSDLLK